MKGGKVLYSCAHTLYITVVNLNDISLTENLRRISVVCNLILCEDCVEVQCFEFRTQNIWSYKISFSLTSAMINNYIGVINGSFNDSLKQLNSLWDLIAKSIYLDRSGVVQLSTQHVVSFPVSTNSFGTQTILLFQNTKTIDDGEKWLIRFRSLEFSYPFYLEISVQFIKNSPQIYKYTVPSHAIQSYFIKYCLDDFYKPDNNYTEEKNNSFTADNNKNSNKMFNAMIEELFYDEETDKIYISSLEKLKIEDYLRESEENNQDRKIDIKKISHFSQSIAFLLNSNNKKLNENTISIYSEASLHKNIINNNSNTNNNQISSDNNDKNINNFDNDNSKDIIDNIITETDQYDNFFKNIFEISKVCNKSIDDKLNKIQNEIKLLANELDMNKITYSTKDSTKNNIDNNRIMNKEVCNNEINSSNQTKNDFIDESNSDVDFILVKSSLSNKSEDRSNISKEIIIKMLKANDELNNVFSICSHEDLLGLVNDMSIKNIENNNEIIVRSGDSVTHCFILLTGNLYCYNNFSADTLVLSPGSIIGFSKCQYVLTDNESNWHYNINTDSDSVSLCCIPIDAMVRFVGYGGLEEADEYMLSFCRAMKIWVSVELHNKHVVDNYNKYLGESLLKSTKLSEEYNIAEQMINIKNIAHIRTYGAGLNIFTQGSPRTFLYIIIDGLSTYARNFDSGNETKNIPSEIDLGGKLLPGDFSILDGEKENFIEQMLLDDNIINNNNMGESKAVSEHRKKKYNRFKTHKNTLISLTRVEVCVFPLSEISKSLNILRKLLQQSIAKYSFILYSDEEVIQLYQNSLKWKKGREVIVQEEAYSKRRNYLK